MKFLLASLLALLLPTAVYAADFPLKGTYRLVSITSEVTATGQRSQPMGDVNGMLTIAADGKAFSIIATGSNAMNAVGNVSQYIQTAENMVSIKRVASSSASTNQVRIYKLHEKGLTMSTVPAKGPDGQESRIIVEWLRLNK